MTGQGGQLLLALILGSALAATGCVARGFAYGPRCGGGISCGAGVGCGSGCSYAGEVYNGGCDCRGPELRPCTGPDCCGCEPACGIGPGCGCASHCGCGPAVHGADCGFRIGRGLHCLFSRLRYRLHGCSGCDGELYWNEWHNDPPRCCDPCTPTGEWIGPAPGGYDGAGQAYSVGHRVHNQRQAAALASEPKPQGPRLR